MAECCKSLSIRSLKHSWWMLTTPLSKNGWIGLSGGCTMLLSWNDLLQDWQFNSQMTCQITTNILKSVIKPYQSNLNHSRRMRTTQLEALGRHGGSGGWLYSNDVVMEQSPVRLAVQVTVDVPHRHQPTAECWKSLSINSLIQSWWTLIAPLSLYGWIWWSGGCTMLLWWIDLLQNWQFNAWLTCHITTNIQQSVV